jgi:hypothetical protein
MFVSCVSETEHQKTLDENTALKSELEEIKFGAPNLLKDGKIFFENKDFKTAREKFNTLIERHSDLPEAIECKKYLAVIDEEEIWQSANNSKDISNVSTYIDKYSNGKYISQAKSLKETLKIQNMQNAYESAEQRNSSSAWKEFLSEYPNHNEASSIRKKIIKLEVDEIYGDSETGKMPSFEQYNYGNSSSSTVKITNNTDCDLVVRYSGTEIEMITIPEGSTRSVSLSSGNYRVAATACGHNYAGSENLSGDYASTFYISTTRY